MASARVVRNRGTIQEQITRVVDSTAMAGRVEGHETVGDTRRANGRIGIDAATQRGTGIQRNNAVDHVQRAAVEDAGAVTGCRVCQNDAVDNSQRAALVKNAGSVTPRVSRHVACLECDCASVVVDAGSVAAGVPGDLACLESQRAGVVDAGSVLARARVSRYVAVPQRERPRVPDACALKILAISARNRHAVQFRDHTAVDFKHAIRQRRGVDGRPAQSGPNNDQIVCDIQVAGGR